MPCPSEQQLLDLLAGQLDETKTTTLRLHIGDCGVCHTRMAELSGEDQARVTVSATPHSDEEAPFCPSERFELLHRLGTGGMGVVYEAFDRQLKAPVALKTLRRFDARLLLRFKGEFRALSDLHHPNLVQLYELFCDEGSWYFSMERLQGVDFLTHVRPEGRLDEARLRAALAQLADGLSALHAAHKVHCDLKPSNVLVADGERVVLVDFGLTRSIADLARSQPIGGTPAFMAPEQEDGRPVGPASDWYAVGVMLFMALTGRKPKELRAAVANDRMPVRPSTLVPDVPPDLDALCYQLLEPDPQARATGKELRACLGTAHAPRVGAPSASFVGRRDELAVLAAALESARRGQSVAVLVAGESGVGKSALVSRFADELIAGGAPLLAGRCYERESVPYKAFDGIIDGLTAFLRNLGPTEVAAVLPPDAALLVEAFPVLSSVRALALRQEAPPEPTRPADPVERRRRMFRALRVLLTALATFGGRTPPLVIVIDDLQWSDDDSLQLLDELARAPSILFLFTGRPATSLALPCELRRLELSGLQPEDARLLALQLLGDQPHHDDAADGRALDALAIAKEAGGHPLFIDELIRHAVAGGAPSRSALQLEEALWARIRRLEPEARRILELVALASGRLLQETAAQAAALPFGELAKHTALLRVAHLVRTSGMRQSDSVEPYHDRVRNAVLSHLDSETLRQRHQRLAVALETSDRVDPEALTVHWREAGDAAKAAHFARVAAEKAARALAFDRAARFYEVCIELLGAETPRLVRVRFADALANAGAGVEAGRAYLEAARGAVKAEALDLQRRGGEQLLRAGHIDDAFEIFRGVRAAIDMPLAETPKRALAGLLLRRAQLRLRGMRFTERSERDVPSSALLRIDTAFSMALVLSTVDTIRGADLQTRSLLLALDAGEPYRIARALALEAGFNAARKGWAGRASTARLVDRARELVERVNHPHALGLSQWAAGGAAYLEGRFADGHALNEQALETYRNRCIGVAWEMASAQQFSLWALHYLGQIGELTRRLPDLLESAYARGDRYDATTLRTSHSNIYWLAADQPAQARLEIADAMTQWSPGGIHLQRYYELYGLAQNEIYTCDGSAAWRRVNEGLAKMKAGFFFELQIVRIEYAFLHARAALASGDPSLWPAAERDAVALEREKTPFSLALAALTRAALAARRGAPDAVPRFELAQRRLKEAGMALHAQAARRALGLLKGGDEGAQLVAGAEAWMREQSIRAPARFAHLINPFRDL